MMNANDLFKAGRLAEAIEAQIQTVKSNPADQGARLFLFELAAFSGDLDRAKRQIEAVKYDDPQIDASVGIYRKLLDSERLRRRLFTESLKPSFFVEPPDHVHKRIEAINRMREGNFDEAGRLLHEANESAPAIHGTLNGQSFDFLMDGDELFGTVLEVMTNAMYFWLPIEQIATLSITPPQTPRDLLWIPARIEFKEGNEGMMFLPTIYPSTYEAGNDELKLGRKTEWTKKDGGPNLGLGQKTFMVGENVISLLEWRELEIA